MQTKLKTDAEGKLENIRLRFKDVPACCDSGGISCSWQIVFDEDWGDGYGVQVVCCGCGDPLFVEAEEAAWDKEEES